MTIQLLNLQPARDRTVEAETWLRRVRFRSGHQPRIQWEPQIAIVAGVRSWPHPVRSWPHPPGLLPEIIYLLQCWDGNGPSIPPRPVWLRRRWDMKQALSCPLCGEIPASSDIPDPTEVRDRHPFPFAGRRSRSAPFPGRGVDGRISATI